MQDDTHHNVCHLSTYFLTSVPWDELNKSESDIGEYLYRQGRCAVAHAHKKPLANPDSYGDKRRLQLDLPLMKEISALFIEQELGVLRESAFWKHLRDFEEKSPELLKKIVAQDGGIIYAETV